MKKEYLSLLLFYLFNKYLVRTISSVLAARERHIYLLPQGILLSSNCTFLHKDPKITGKYVDNDLKI